MLGTVFRRIVVCVAIGWGAANAWAAQVTVAVAANFSAVAQKIAAHFQRDTGHQVVLVPGSTGALYAQIRHGAPFQVLLSADQDTPRKLVEEGFAVRGSRYTYATGRLALWSKSPEGVDPQGQVLRASGLQRLAIANPKLAPYGAAAIQALTALGLWPALQSKVVQGENITQAHQFVQTGNAPMGLVAWSQIWVDGQLSAGSAWLVPEHLHAPLHQDAVLLKPGQDQAAATAWLAYLRQPAAQAIIRAHGYQL
jgi:molybdate transport system substrate-binding protein